MIREIFIYDHISRRPAFLYATEQTAQKIAQDWSNRYILFFIDLTTEV